MFDVKKIISSPKNQFEAIDSLVKKEQELIEALHIMESLTEYPKEIDFHVKKAKEFLNKFK